MRVLLAVVAALSAQLVFAQAASKRVLDCTYYVSTTGSDRNAGTLRQPFATVNHGVRVTTAGKTLCIRGGTCHEWLNDVIHLGATIAARPGETVILQIPAMAERGVLIDNAGSIELVGLILDGRKVISRSADGVKISYQTGGAAPHAHDILLRNVESAASHKMEC